jgi:hypothetical protein
LERKLGVAHDRVLRAHAPRGREAVNYLAAAARELEPLARRGSSEPEIPARPKFMHED